MSTNLLQPAEKSVHEEQQTTIQRIYYLFEVEVDSPVEATLQTIVNSEFENPRSVVGLDSWASTQGQSISEALADFIETLGVLEQVAMWLAVMSLRGIRP